MFLLSIIGKGSPIILCIVSPKQARHAELPRKMQTVKMKMQNDRATVNKKLKFKKRRCKERYSIFKFWVLICHFYF